MTNRFPQFNLCFHNIKFVKLLIGESTERLTEIYTELLTELYTEPCTELYIELSTELHTEHHSNLLTDFPNLILGVITSSIIYSLLNY